MQARRRLAGVGPAAAARGQLLAERVRDRRRDRSTDGPGRNCERCSVWLPMSFSCSWWSMIGTTRDSVDHVGGEEHRHRAGDRLDRLVGGLGVAGERGAHVVGDGLQAGAGGSSSSGTSAARGSSRPAWRSAAPACTGRRPWPRNPLICEGQVVALRRVAQQVEERLGDLLVRGPRERADVLVVVAHRVLLRGALAAADDEDEECGASRIPPPSAARRSRSLLVIGGWGTAAGGGGRRPGRGRTRVCGSSSSSKKDKKVSLLDGRTLVAQPSDVGRGYEARAACSFRCTSEMHAEGAASRAWKECG